MRESRLATVELDAPSEATVEVVARVLGISEGDIDPEFGVVEVNSKRHRYAVRVAADALKGKGGSRKVKLHADPPIEAFG